MNPGTTEPLVYIPTIQRSHFLYLVFQTDAPEGNQEAAQKSELLVCSANNIKP